MESVLSVFSVVNNYKNFDFFPSKYTLNKKNVVILSIIF